MMGVDSRRPPLPAPTESMDETSGVETELATNITSRTDKTSYSIPEDGSPITISTQKAPSTRDGHLRQKSQTSLLIEYFEAAKTGDKARSRPSVRVKVTPGATKKGKGGGRDAVQITGIGKDRKPSYTRRISLTSSKDVETGHREGTEISHTSESDFAAQPPVEIEVLNHSSDVSNDRSSRGLLYAAEESNVSSMPPDSILEGPEMTKRERGLGMADADRATVSDDTYLAAPTGVRDRSTSRDRIAQKVIAKLGQDGVRQHKSRRSREFATEYEPGEKPTKEYHRRLDRSRHVEDEPISGAESSMLSSQLSASQVSYRSDRSRASRMTNNPKLVGLVEDTIRRMILPEIDAIKEERRTDRNLDSSGERQRSSLPRDGYEESNVSRRVSKSSSSPNISSRSKAVLNRDGDDTGPVLSRGDFERKRTQKSSRESHSEYRSSSRRSSGRHSRQGDGYDDEATVRHKSKSGHGLRDAAAGAIAGGVLTAAALKHHDSQEDIYERRRRRTKSHGSRSRSVSITESLEKTPSRKEEIPPMPLASHVNDSELTRDSIVSSAAEQVSAPDDVDIRTPVREVSRGSISEPMSPASRTPTRTPVGRGLGMSHTNQSIESPLSGRRAQRDIGSPAQSVSSLKQQFEDEESLVPRGSQAKSAALRSSATHLRGEAVSRGSLQSHGSTPVTKLTRSRNESQNLGGDVYANSLEEPDVTKEIGATGTPAGETVDDWFERQHELNDRYRDSMGEIATTNRDSYQTNPYPEDDKRFTMLSENSPEGSGVRGLGTEQGIRPIGAVPDYVHTPAGVESAVASLMEPSTVSSAVLSTHADESPVKQNGTFADRKAAHFRELGQDGLAMYEGSTLSQTMPSEDRWAALKGHARSLSATTSQDRIDERRSPHQSDAKSLREERSVDEAPVMVASGLPIADDPLPEIGHYDSQSELATNPSIVHGPLGGDTAGRDAWPYTPEPSKQGFRDHELKGIDKKDPLFAAAADGYAVLAAMHAARQPTVEDEPVVDEIRLTPDVRHGGEIDREATPTSPLAFRDEGYATDVHNRSIGAITPGEEPNRFSKQQLDEFNRAMNAQDLGNDDLFTDNVKHARHVSGNSHGMASPIYDSATGKGANQIQSKDIVALMDHLTVRDMQRNARDTEMLVSLVRVSAEMRQSFDEIRNFIKEQDRLIMQNTERSAESTAQKVLGGPRPQPSSAFSGTSKRESQEDVQNKRRNVLRRALKGLTGGRRAEDLARIEEMLMQILENVEDLKQNSVSQQPQRSYINDSLDSYEKLRAAPDSGYEPEGQAGTSSTPSQSGQFPVPPRAEKQQFHSGYDGRRGSVNRVSTVLEGDEGDELEPHEEGVLNNQFENNERMLTPTQEVPRLRGDWATNTPPQHARAVSNGAQPNELTPKSADKQQKHRSNNSSIMGNAKVSRWSKTSSSSAAPDPAGLESPNVARTGRPASDASRSGSEVEQYDALPYEQARATSQADAHSVRSRASRITRTPSPLIPSEISARQEEEYETEPHLDMELEFDDPKYQAHRNSLLLQHPQPRAGTTGRHQNNLESQAHTYDGLSATNSDVSQKTISDNDPLMFGSSGTAALARARLSQIEPLSPVSLSSSRHGSMTARKDESPLVPQSKSYATTPKTYQPEPEPEPEDWEPQYSNSGFSRGGYYSSPYGSGHLLEPIEEVRYSLETDSGHMSPEPQVSSARAVAVRPQARKITGPRPMESKSPQPKLAEPSGTVRRKAVGAKSQESMDSDTF